MRSFRIVSCFTGRPIPELWMCQQHVHCLSRYGCAFLYLCMSCGNARNRLTHVLRTQKKNSLGIDPSTTFTTISISQGTACTAFVPSPPPRRNVLCTCMCTSSNRSHCQSCWRIVAPCVEDMDFCSRCASLGPLVIRAVLKELNFFLFRAALKDHPSEHFTTDDPT